MSVDGDDIFAALHTVEEDAVQHGYDEGVQEGLVAGLVEGRHLGVQKGFELGDELGFYMGCARAWRWQQQHQQNRSKATSSSTCITAVPQRAERGLAALEEMLNSFPILDPQDERLQELMERIRGKFKAVVATLGHAQPLSYAQTQPAGVSF